MAARLHKPPPHKPTTGPSRARLARELAGLTLEDAAKRARVTPGYLATVERQGAPYVLAQRLSKLYDCRIDLFLPVRT